MTQEEKTKYEHETVMLRVKRHINMGERTFQNTETSVFNMSGTPLTEQLENLREIRETLNTWESEERANYRLMQKTIREQEKAFIEREDFENDKKNAEFRNRLMEFIEENPQCGTDDLTLTFEISKYELESHLHSLRNQGKIKTPECSESFLISDDDDTEEDFD